MRKQAARSIAGSNDFSKKLLVICGPTGVGKTALAINLAKKFNGELVSADSRQIYKGLDVATGKEYADVPIHLMDVVEPEENFSVAQYYQLATRAINHIRAVKKLPIVVGGTGLYIKSVLENLQTLGIPPNLGLRTAYEGKTASQLLMILARLNPDLANSLNESEKSNKQRLIRRIEVAQTGAVADFTAQRQGSSEVLIPRSEKRRLKSANTSDVLQIALTAPYPILKERIFKRIDAWVKEGAQEEVEKLIKRGVGWDSQSMSSLGYKEWKPYFEGTKTKEDVILEWKTKEWQYAKRQITWFKKDPSVAWLDITSLEYPQNVETHVETWYNR